MKKLRVLIIDDSAYNRQTIAEILGSHAEIEVVGKAFDGEEGLKLASQLGPDLITLDIEMPRMDGFTFLRLLMARMPTPVIVISSHSRKEEVFQALELGALDFLAKPSHHISPELANLRDELITKVMTVRALQPVPFAGRRAKAEPQRAALAEPARVEAPRVNRDVQRVVCIGASTGGPPALEYLFRSLPVPQSSAFLVAQHMPEKFTRAFAERLNRMVGLHVCEAEAGMPLSAGAAYVAPGGFHLALAPSAEGGFELELRPPSGAERYVPSIDVLFESAALRFGPAALAVVLTGMGSDGRAGVEAVRAARGRTVAESAESAIVFGMPKEAIQSGCIDEVVPLAGIAERIRNFVL